MTTNQNFVIAISREIGAGGRTAGHLLSKELGVEYFDKAVIEGLIEHFNLSVEEIEKTKGQKMNAWLQFCEKIAAAPAYDSASVSGEVTVADLYKVEKHIITNIAQQQSCVIAGRSASFILKDHPRKISVFIHAPYQDRLARVMAKQSISEAEAAKLIKTVDTRRENFIKRFTDSSRYDLHGYDLVINSSSLPSNQAVADVILDFARKSIGI